MLFSASQLNRIIRRRTGRLPVVPALTIMTIVLAGCATRDTGGGYSSEKRTGVQASPRLVAEGQPVPKGGGVYKLGSPYRIASRWYVPKDDPGYDETGLASWYGADFHGRKTANGEIFDRHALTAAHPTLPLPSYVYVTNLDNGRTLLLRVNDRGPYAHDRVLDLSQASARLLGSEQKGLARVRVRYAGRAPLSGDDSHEQKFLAGQPWFARHYAGPEGGRAWPRRYSLGAETARAD